MSMKPLQELVRPNIWALKPYSSARDEYKGAAASVFLDANENPYNAPYNRYPDPLQLEVKEMLAPVKGVKPDKSFSVTAVTKPSTWHSGYSANRKRTTWWR